MESILVSAQIKQGHHQAVREIIDEGPPFELPIDGIERHCVFMNDEEVCFLFEGPPGLRRIVRSLVFKRGVASQTMRIGVHIEGKPHEFDTILRWSADD